MAFLLATGINFKLKCLNNSIFIFFSNLFTLKKSKFYLHQKRFSQVIENSREEIILGKYDFDTYFARIPNSTDYLLYYTF